MIDPDKEYSVQIAVVTDGRSLEDIAEGKQASHDAVLKHAGARRASGVTWEIFDRDDFRLTRLLRTLEEGEGQSLTSVRRLLRNNPNAVLVVARAEVAPAIPDDKLDEAIVDLQDILSASYRRDWDEVLDISEKLFHLDATRFFSILCGVAETIAVTVRAPGVTVDDDYWALEFQQLKLSDDAPTNERFDERDALWVGQFLTAQLNDDKPTQLALFQTMLGTVPEEGHLSAVFVALVAIAGKALREMPREREPSS